MNELNRKVSGKKCSCEKNGFSPGEPLEEFAHSHVVKLIGAVEHNTLDGHSLGQILSCLCFTRTRRSSRGTTKLQMESASQRQVTSEDNIVENILFLKAKVFLKIYETLVYIIYPYTKSIHIHSNLIEPYCHFFFNLAIGWYLNYVHEFSNKLSNTE